MKQTGFAEEQIVAILKQSEAVGEGGSMQTERDQ
jgi:hypothetical protein